MARDYYDILGVERSAEKAEIKKAVIAHSGQPLKSKLLPRNTNQRAALPGAPGAGPMTFGALPGARSEQRRVR